MPRPSQTLQTWKVKLSEVQEQFLWCH